MRRKGATISLEAIRNSACAHLNGHLFRPEEKRPKRSKYGNKKTEFDGIVFDSAREAKRYKELKILLKAGAIGMLERQVPFELNPGGQFSLRYIADFVYIDTITGEKIVEDVKGFRTREYKRKKRLMKKIHGININET